MVTRLRNVFCYLFCFPWMVGCGVERSSDGLGLGLRGPVSSVCGDGVVEGTEVCDEGIHNSNNQIEGCRLDCTYLSCGEEAYAALDSLGSAGCVEHVIWEGDIRIETATDLQVYKNVTRVMGNVVIGGHLNATVNLPNLREIGGNLWVWDSSVLLDFSFATLEVIGANLLIRNNTQLRDFSLEGLGKIGGSLTVVYNPVLPTCAAKWFSDGLGSHNILGAVEIKNNKPDDCSGSIL